MANANHLDDARAATPEVLRRYIEQQSNWRKGKDEQRIAYETSFQEYVLSNFWGVLYEKTNDGNFLDESIRFAHSAVQNLKDTDHYERTSILDAASTWILSRFQNKGDVQDLSDCIRLRRRNLEHPPADYKTRGRLVYQKNQALSIMYDRLNDEACLLDALPSQKELVDYQIERHNFLNLDELNMLIHLYCANFQRTKELPNLQDALRWGDIAVRAAGSGTSVPCWYVRAARSMTLYFHYRQNREYKSLEQALQLSKSVQVEISVRNKKERATDFGNHAIMLVAKYERERQKDPRNPLASLDLLDEAIDCTENGIRTIQSDGEVHLSDELEILAGLHDKAGFLFGEKFRATKNPSFGRQAVDHAQTSVRTLPENHLYRPFHSSNLAASLVSMYRSHSQSRTSKSEDEKLATLDEALKSAREAVNATQENDPELAQRLNNLGVIEVLQGLNIHSKGTHFPEARESFLRAARLDFAHPIVRISAGLRVGRMFLQGREPKRADEVLQEVMSLIPSISPRSNSVEDLQDVLTGVTGLSNLAAAAALEAGSSSEQAAWKALRTLESGRCVIAGLRMSSGAEGSAHDSKLPPSTDELKRLASEGPIITFNVERARSDAIVVTPHGVKVLFLPHLKYGELEERLQLFLSGGMHSGRNATPTAEDPLEKSPLALFQGLDVSVPAVTEGDMLDIEEMTDRSNEERHVRVRVKREDLNVNDFLKWIWTAAVKPVLESIDDTEMQPSR